ncbi:efflux RND transporter permease subunit [Shouchella patagoniensis]|uniref:efflux RND transporter permease subunit n=1 Tax=Shouchella patagoniensis TaxID=228576 RepID=UPI000994E6C3|nr:efflux RND transporter permease subunit [Shouchella patagoniensis]
MNWIINRPKLVILFFVMLTAIGAISFLQMPQREIPEFSPPIGQITTAFPGATSEAVEQQVTNQIEEVLSQFDEIEQYQSVSAPSISLVTVELDESVGNVENVWNDISQSINQVATAFPDDAREPELDTDLGDQGLATYQITYDNNVSIEELQQTIETYASDISGLNDIIGLDVQGVLEKEISVMLDPEAMEDAEISFGQVMGILDGENDTAPIGAWQDERGTYPVNLDTYSSVELYNQLPVGVDEQGEIIRLSDVGTMEETYKQREEQVYYDGEQALSLTFTLRSGSSVPAAQNELDRFVEQLEGDLPEGAEMELLYTQSELVSELFVDLALSFAFAILAVLIVCSLGLRIGTALSVAFAVPISLSIGSIALPFFNVDLNQISLIAYILVLAILVDDAIVVNDNIERQLREGKAPKEAARKGTREVLVSVITSTIIVVFTFFPILFLPGGAGEFIRPLPVVVISAIMASTLVGLIAIPIYRVWKEKRKPSAKNERPAGILGPFLSKAGQTYSQKWMPNVVKHPFYVGFGGLLIGTAAYALIPWIPIEFFPDSDREEVFIETTLADGTPLEQTEEQSKEMAAWIAEHDFVQSVSTYTGTSIPRLFNYEGGGEESENMANFLVFIDKEQVEARAAMDEWSETLPETFENLESYEVSIIESGPPVGAPIAIEMTGPSISELMEKSAEAQDILANASGVVNVDDDVGTPVDSYLLELNRSTMEENGLASSDVAGALAAVGEGIPLGTFDVDGELIDWRIAYEGNEIDLLEQVTVTGNTQQAVALADLVSINEAEIQPRIPHQNGERTITIRAFPAEGQSADDIVAEVEDELFALEDGEHSIVIGGETSERTDVFIQIGQIFILVVFLILIVMVIQFYSITIPFIILSAVYLAFSGAMIGLFITQTGLGFMSLMGGVSLAGIVVRNGIVLIEFIEQRRKAGLSPKDAVLLAAEQRFRPIVLTSLTTIAGLLPIALGNSTLFKPLGITIVSGALFSAILTLFVVPALYLVRVRWKEGKIS